MDTDLDQTHETGKYARTIRFIVPGRLEDVFLVGLGVRGICSSLPLDPEAVYQVELSVVEAVNNAIRHAYRDREGHEVEVLVSLFPDRILFRVIDDGRGMDLESTPVFDFDPEDLEGLPEGGMGLHIIRSVMDRVEYASRGGRNILTMSKAFEKQEKPG